MSVEEVEASAVPAATPRRAPGRPKGAKTDPRKKAARTPRAPRAGGRTAAEAPGPIIPPSPDDKAAETLADALARAAVPPRNAVGRPTEEAKLAKSLAIAYEAFGGMVGVAGVALTLGNGTRAIGQRVQLVGAALRDNAEACGTALARWAETNPAVKKFLTQGSSTSAILMVCAAHAPVVLAAFGRDDLAPVVGAVAGLVGQDAGTPLDDGGTPAAGGSPLDLGAMLGGDMMQAFASMFTAPATEAPAA